MNMEGRGVLKRMLAESVDRMEQGEQGRGITSRRGHMVIEPYCCADKG